MIQTTLPSSKPSIMSIFTTRDAKQLELYIKDHGSGCISPDTSVKLFQIICFDGREYPNTLLSMVKRLMESGCWDVSDVTILLTIACQCGVLPLISFFNDYKWINEASVVKESRYARKPFIKTYRPWQSASNNQLALEILMTKKLPPKEYVKLWVKRNIFDAVRLAKTKGVNTSGLLKFVTSHEMIKVLDASPEERASLAKSSPKIGHFFGFELERLLDAFERDDAKTAAEFLKFGFFRHVPLACEATHRYALSCLHELHKRNYPMDKPTQPSEFNALMYAKEMEWTEGVESLEKIL